MVPYINTHEGTVESDGVGFVDEAMDGCGDARYDRDRRRTCLAEMLGGIYEPLHSVSAQSQLQVNAKRGSSADRHDKFLDFRNTECRCGRMM